VLTDESLGGEGTELESPAAAALAMSRRTAEAWCSSAGSTAGASRVASVSSSEVKRRVDTAPPKGEESSSNASKEGAAASFVELIAGKEVAAASPPNALVSKAPPKP